MKLASKVFIITFFFLMYSGIVASAQSKPPESKQPLRVLYVGSTAKPSDFKEKTISYIVADPERMQDFRQLLEKYFVSVKTCEASAFTPELAKDADVIIMDAKVPGGVPSGWRKPTVVIGGSGLFSVENTGTKINWL